MKEKLSDQSVDSTKMECQYNRLKQVIYSIFTIVKSFFEVQSLSWKVYLLFVFIPTYVIQ